jgi:hypothetical protein
VTTSIAVHSSKCCIAFQTLMPPQCPSVIVFARPAHRDREHQEENTMTQDIRLSARTRPDEIRIWQHGELPLPEWMPPHMIGDIEFNGTFEVSTDHGHVRVHPGNTVIERHGTVWVCPTGEAPTYIDSLKQTASGALNNIGPGKASRFGTATATRNKGRKHKTITEQQRPRYPAPIGCFPSIEWVHITRLSIDSTYQRSTDNSASRRLIASIAAKFDWRLCAPLVVSRRADDVLTIIDGQHRWMAACQRDDIPQLPCCVFRYENMKEEARMFIVANRARKPINRLDDYYAALAAADEDALEIEQLVRAAGFRMARARPGVPARSPSLPPSLELFKSSALRSLLAR